MFLDRAFSFTLRNLSTLFLMVLVVSLPLHLVYAFAFRKVIAVAELHSSIENFSPQRQVQGVGRDLLATSRWVFLALTVVEIGAILLLARGARRVAQVDAAGGVPTVAGALRSLGSKSKGRTNLRALLPALGAALVIALAVTLLAERAGVLVVEPLGPDLAFLGIAVARAGARSLGAPFLLGVLALGAHPAKGAGGGTPTL